MKKRINNIKNKSVDGSNLQMYTLEFIVESIKDIIFDVQYLATLKQTILKLANSQIEQKDLKKLIIEHGLNSVEDIRKLIKLCTEAEKKRLIKRFEQQEEKIKKYNQLLLKIAPRVEKIYEKLNSKKLNKNYRE